MESHDARCCTTLNSHRALPTETASPVFQRRQLGAGKDCTSPERLGQDLNPGLRDPKAHLTVPGHRRPRGFPYPVVHKGPAGELSEGRRKGWSNNSWYQKLTSGRDAMWVVKEVRGEKVLMEKAIEGFEESSKEDAEHIYKCLTITCIPPPHS